MDKVDPLGKPDASEEDKALAGAGGVMSGLECPKETLEEHLPTHKQL